MISKIKGPFPLLSIHSQVLRTKQYPGIFHLPILLGAKFLLL
jgi:hypothetical protein